MFVRWPAWLAVRRGLASSKASMMLTPRSSPAIQSRLSRPAGGVESSGLVGVMGGSVPASGTATGLEWLSKTLNLID